MTENITLWVIKGNTDTTEGRGGLVDRALYHDLSKATELIESGQAKSKWGVMGVGDVELFQRTLTFNENGTVSTEEFKLYGYRKDWKGKWGYGYTDSRDLPVEDPEFVEYLRLRKKFGIDD